MKNKKTRITKSILVEKIGIAGCGSMGLPMLKTLLKNNIDACGYDIKPKKNYIELKENFIPFKEKFCSDNKIIISVVRDIEQTEELCKGKNGLFKTKEKKILIICSTLSPFYLKQLKLQKPNNITLIDAPISGAPNKAKNGTLTIMVGTKKNKFNYISPLLKIIGKNIIHIGDYGSGMTVKVLNNFVAASSVLSVRHVLHEATNLGIKPKQLLKVLNCSSGKTWFGDNIYDIDWSAQSYNKYNTIGILEKDVLSYIDALNKSNIKLDISIKNFHRSIIKGLIKIPNFPKK